MKVINSRKEILSIIILLLMILLATGGDATNSKRRWFKRNIDEIEQRREDLDNVLPLLSIIKSEFITVNHLLEGKSGEDKEILLKAYEKHCHKTYFPLLLKINIRQGRLLLKLIDRELGDSSYNIIYQYLGRKRARFWQKMAKVFSADLKVTYDPEEDLLTENLMVRLFDSTAKSLSGRTSLGL